MSVMSLTPDNVSPEVFARMLIDPELRPLLGMNISATTADTVAASPGLTAHYYNQWAAGARAAEPAVAPETAHARLGDPTTSPRLAAPHVAHRVDTARPTSTDAASTLRPLDLRLAVHAVVWPAASLVMVGLTLILAIALARSDDRNLGPQAAIYWTGVGYFFAIILGILGIVFGIKSIHRGLRSKIGTPRRFAAITWGTIGLVASVWFVLGWLVGWVTL